MSPSPIDRPDRPGRPRPSALRAWLGRQAARWKRPHLLFVAADGVWAWSPRGAPEPARYDDVPAWCQAHAGEAARLVISGHLTLQVLAHEPSMAIAGLQTIAAWARHQFGHYHGADAERWPLAAWADGGVAGASALRGLDLSTVAAAGAAHGVSLASAMPWWAVALRAVSRERPGLAQHPLIGLLLVEGMAATWVLCEQGAVVDLQQRWLAAPGAEAVDELLHSLRAGLPGDMPCWLLGYGCVGERREGERGDGAHGEEEVALQSRADGAVMLSGLDGAWPRREWVNA